MFLDQSDVLWATDGTFAVQKKKGEKKGHRVVLIHFTSFKLRNGFSLVLTIRVPDVDSMQVSFLFTSPSTCENGLMENAFVAFQWKYSEHAGALFGLLWLSATSAAAFRTLEHPERNKPVSGW